MDRGSILRVWLPLLAGLWGLGWAYLYGPGPHDGLRSVGAVLGLAGLGGGVLRRFPLGSFLLCNRQSPGPRDHWNLCTHPEPDLRVVFGVRRRYFPDRASAASMACTGGDHRYADRPRP